MIKPKAPPYDALEWATKPFPEKARMVCQAWAIQGYGSPIGVYLVYALKVVGYIYGWAFFCSFSAASAGIPTMGQMTQMGDWWLQPVVFQKAILWSMFFEVLGLGCGSGPLTGRYMPPLGGVLYFLRPGTTKLAFFPGAPLIGGDRRSILDVALYLALLIFSVLALVHPAPGLREILPLVILVPLCGLLDKTIFLAARAEHYWTTLVCFAFAGNWIAGAMAVQLALWFFAGFSKLNHHFPTVVCVMASNSPFTPFQWFRKAMYRNYPDDLRPSSAATLKAHMGIALELGVPIVLLAGVLLKSPAVITVGLVMMLMLHSYITSNVPMGVPIEWNFMVVYGAFFLFLANGHLTPFDVGSLPVGIFLILVLLVVPLLGNLKPHWISFLLAMRYYAGNWAVSVWLFKGEESYRKLDKLKKSSPWLYDQLDKIYDRKTGVGLLGKVIAFRLMHLHGRIFQKLLPKALAGQRFQDYEWLDGELVAGLALGWNFGEGHLHNEQLLENLQRQCGFEPGEVRCMFVESQPLGSGRLAYRIADAASGEIENGSVAISELRELQAWPA